jgi:hypothetical protein
MHQVTQEGLDIQDKAGFPFLQGLEPTLRAINALWFFAQRSGRAPAIVGPAPPSDLTPATLDATLARNRKAARWRARRRRLTLRRQLDFRSR